MPYYIKKPKKKKEKPLPLFDKAGIKIKKKPDLQTKIMNYAVLHQET